MQIKEISRKEYDRFLEKAKPYSFIQTSKMNEVLKSVKSDTRLLALVNKEEILAVGLAYIRNMFGGKRVDFMAGANALNEKYDLYFMIK